MRYVLAFVLLIPATAYADADADACAALALAKAARERQAVVTPAAPAVAAPQPFRNPTHTCPVCGRNQFVIYGPGPVAGTHTHRCAFDGTVWFH